MKKLILSSSLLLAAAAGAMVALAENPARVPADVDEGPFGRASSAEKAAEPAPPKAGRTVFEGPAEPGDHDNVLLPTGPEDATEPTRDEMFKAIGTALKQEGTTRDDVYTITLPREDLVVSIEGQIDVPTAAGIESEFRFFQCPCGGKISVIGQFVTADYEANDVVDALREGHLVIVSVGPFLMYEHPRLSVVRFQGEGKPEDLGKTLKKALEWTGDNRGKPQRIEN